MLFNSFSFLIFFAILCAVYFSLPNRFRPALLLIGSYLFYISWMPVHAILLAGLTLFNFYIAIRMERESGLTGRKLLLAASILSNAGMLFSLKYLSLFAGAVNTIMATTGSGLKVPVLGFLLPLGISFYTLKIMNYTIDVYRGKKAVERNLLLFGLYVAFFPQLISGPIDRSTGLLPQFHESRDFDYDRVADGLRLMLWGFFQKLVIADNLAAVVDPVFNNPTAYQGPTLSLASVLFSFQIYCDFSGYSDIAIGAARVLGYQSMNNFERPYLSTSIPEFWKRWHISLSTWFRDYLYIPLGGNRTTLSRWYANLFIVFVVSGLWHGSNWTFLMWGALHGFYYICSMITRNLRKRLSAAARFNRMPRLQVSARCLMTFVLVTFAWIFFRANSVSDALFIITHLFSGWEGKMIPSELLLSSRFEFLTGMAAVIFMIVLEICEGREPLWDRFRTRPLWLRWAVYYGGVLLVLLLGSFGSRQFIYFQF
jgi:alginate O-acetyltransferase complex protein AlgI